MINSLNSKSTDNDHCLKKEQIYLRNCDGSSNVETKNVGLVDIAVKLNYCRHIITIGVGWAAG